MRMILPILYNEAEGLVLHSLIMKASDSRHWKTMVLMTPVIYGDNSSDEGII